MFYLDIHTHRHRPQEGVYQIQSLSFNENLFLAMPKTKPVSMGLHPWYARLEQLQQDMAYLGVAARQENVKMIGECGLDKTRGESIEKQLIIFEQQLRLAQELNKPLIIHCVKAFDELIALKKRLKPSIPLIIHGFQKNEAMALQLHRQGFYLSFGAALSHSPGLQQVIRRIDFPFFLETDDAPADIASIYEAVARLKKIAVEELKDRIFALWKACQIYPGSPVRPY